MQEDFSKAPRACQSSLGTPIPVIASRRRRQSYLPSDTTNPRHLTNSLPNIDLLRSVC